MKTPWLGGFEPGRAGGLFPAGAAQILFDASRPCAYPLLYQTAFQGEYSMRSSVSLALVWVLLAMPLARSDEGIPRKTLDELKAATVYVKLDGGNWHATGSGFLIQADGDVGIVVTNHHVAFAARRGDAPGKISLVFWSGTENEKVFTAEIIGSDAEHDLAVLRVKAKDLPKPLDINQKVELRETMTLYTFGFPLGERLSTTKGNPALTVGKGAVGSIRNDDKGKLKIIQLDGELNPGNSGGPVVDEKGRLIGIAVAKIVDTKISFAIPPAQLTDLLNGRISSFIVTTLKVENGAAVLQCEALLNDPLNKLKSLEIRYVRKENLKEMPKADKDGNWPELPGADKAELKVDGQKAAITFTLKNAEKKVVEYLLQAVSTNGEGKFVYTQPTACTINFGLTIVVRPGGSGAITEGSGSASQGSVTVTPPPSIGQPSGQDFAFATKLPRFLTAQIHPKSGTLFLTTADGYLKHYSYPEFKFLGDYKLDGVAYQTALDANVGLLYLAVAKEDKFKAIHPRAENREEAVGDIRVYEVMHLLDKKGEPGSELKYTTEFKADTVIRQLSLSPDGAWLYFLDVKKPDNVSLVRINTKTKKFDGELKLADKTETMFLTADGKTIYATAAPDGHSADKDGPYNGVVQKIDPTTMKLLKKTTINADPANVVATNDGTVFISGGSGQHTEITIVDMKETFSVTAHWKGIYMGAWLGLSPDCSKLFFCTRGLSPSSMESWVIPGSIDDTVPLQKTKCWEDPKKPVGGPMYISPDGKCLLSPAGGAFWLAEAKAEK
jgi:S1-C subfamily serine protease